MANLNASTSTPRRVLAWLDEHFLLLMAGFLIAFIPAYPKLPLADILPGYIVRLRMEDLFVAVTFLFWFLQVLRRKISIKTPLTKIIFIYLVVGFASTLSAIFITHTVPMSAVHIEKLYLHYFRRIEYFSLFFIAFTAIKTKKQVVKLLAIFVAATLFIGVYGVGQKFLYWPVYSTMNREFSKGLRLYLTQYARVQSTFGGHYDFAAYLVVALPLMLALFFYVKKKWMKAVLGVTFVLGLWGLMMTSSRSSFLAYMAAITFVVVGWSIRQKKLVLGALRLSAVYLITFSFFFVFGDLSARFAQIFNGNAALQGLQQSIENSTKPIVPPPQNGISVDDVEKAAAVAAAKQAQVPVVVASDTRPSTTNPADEALPPDVKVNVPASVIATKSASGKDIEIVMPRIFSENAHRLGLSAAIRLDTLWPFAIRGFLRNPLLGSGYSTLTKYANDEFTEAESTDNDFLRTLGETGALGFITFYGTLVVSCIYLWKKTKHSDDMLLFLFALVLTSVTIGLFVNAVYIDVFVSSKVIETYWMLAGVFIAYAALVTHRQEQVNVLAQKLLGKKKTRRKTS